MILTRAITAEQLTTEELNKQLELHINNIKNKVDYNPQSNMELERAYHKWYNVDWNMFHANENIEGIEVGSKTKSSLNMHSIIKEYNPWLAAITDTGNPMWTHCNHSAFKKYNLKKVEDIHQLCIDLNEFISVLKETGRIFIYDPLYTFIVKNIEGVQEQNYFTSNFNAFMIMKNNEYLQELLQKKVKEQ
jgi:hypothetical protein